MKGKSPLTKALVGKQGKLPENLKAAIKAAPGPSPATMVSPLKEGDVKDWTEYQKTLKAARAAGMSQFDYNKKLKEEGSQMKTRVAQEEANRKRTAELKAQTAESNRKFAERNSKQAVKETGPTAEEKRKAAAKKAAAGGDRFSKAYEIAKKKYPKAYGKMTLAEYTAEAKKQIANRKETGKYIGGTKKLTEAEKKAAEQKKLKEAAEQKKLKEEKEAADNSDKIVKEAQLEKAKKEAEKAAAEKIRLAKAEEYNKKNLKPRSRSRRKVKVDVVKDKKTGARLKTKTRTRKDGTVKTKVKETRIIGGVASKTRKVEDDRKKRNKKDKNKNGKNGNSTGVNRR